MTRFPTSGVLLLLLALFATPASAQVIMGGSPLGIPGSGTVTSVATTSPITGGTITSSGTIACATCTTSAGMTTGVIPMASGAHALVDNLNAALIGTNGTYGFNTAHYPEIVNDGASLSNPGAGSALTIHEAVDSLWSLAFWKDSNPNGVLDLVAFYTDPKYFSVNFGDGLGGTKLALELDGSASGHAGLYGTNFQFGFPGSTTITSPSGGFVNFDLSGTPSTPSGYSNAFRVANVTIPESTISGASTFILAQQDGTLALTLLDTANNAGTAAAGIKSEIIGNSASSTKAAATMEVIDAQSDVSLNLFSPTNNAIVSNVGALSLNSTSVTAGSAPYMYFAVPGGATGFAIHAPDAMAGGATKLFTWPSDKPSATGQPLVATNASPSVWSFAAGATIGATDVTVIGHYLSSTTTPAVTNTTANSCGTTAATIVGTDVSGRITVGATAGTSCTVTFTTAFANAPICVANDETTGNLMRATASQTTVIIAGTMVAGDKVTYICLGRV